MKERISALFQGVGRRHRLRSGSVTGLILLALVVGLSIAYRERGTGKLTKLKAKIGTDDQFQETPTPRPGGQEAIVLTRSQLAGGSMPEFLSMTLLPGRGLNVLQIRAYIPHKGEVDLLASPSLEEATAVLNGKDADANGQASLAMGAAFEAPWAGRFDGASASGGRVTTSWRGHAISLPATRTNAGSEVAMGGLLLGEASSSQSISGMPDGGQTRVVFTPGVLDAEGGPHWPSRTEVTVTAVLGSRTIELTVSALNVGDVAEPVGIGWFPRFAVSESNREQMMLRLPGEMRIETSDRQGGAPTGRIVPLTGTPYDFEPRDGRKLGRMELDDTFVQLHQELLDSGPVAELSDPANNYGLRLTALTPTIKAFHVQAPAQGGFIAIDPRFNYDDPLGHEWPSTTDTGMVVLQPGESTQWKIRLELFSLTRTEPPI